MGDRAQAPSPPSVHQRGLKPHPQVKATCREEEGTATIMTHRHDGNQEFKIKYAQFEMLAPPPMLLQHVLLGESY